MNAVETRTYIHERVGWPTFAWNRHDIADLLSDVRYHQGRLFGRMEGLGFELRTEATLHTLTEDVVRSGEIEGDHLDEEQVRSSIARRLGMDIGALPSTDRHIEGAVEMMLDATQTYRAPLSDERLFAWHAALFPTGRSGMRRIIVGAWRDDASGPMQVVSGPIGSERVHFQAPEAGRLSGEMAAFLRWFNSDSRLDPVLKAAAAHLWFVTLHPFDDGNGRIARAITDIALARSEGSPRRFYSMSAQISRQREDYYAILEATQRGGLDITAWLKWFLLCLRRAIEGAENTLGSVIDKARFWGMQTQQTLNERQRKVISRLLDGFEGKLTTSKWARLTKVSSDTALRDINDLVGRGLLVRDEGGGRSTSYSLVSISGRTRSAAEDDHSTHTP